VGSGIATASPKGIIVCFLQSPMDHSPGVAFVSIEGLELLFEVFLSYPSIASPYWLLLLPAWQI